MEFTWRQNNAFTGIFYASDVAVNAAHNAITLLNKDTFSKMCVVDLAGTTIEIPTFLRGVFEIERVRNQNNTKLVFPLYSNCSDSNKRTSDSIINSFFRYGNITARLQKVTTRTGNVYYGMKGLIMDKDFKPLFFTTLTFDSNNNVYNKATIYIHPEVFLNTTGILQKAIIKKLIPFYSEISLNSYCIRNHYPIERNIKPSIIIEDVSSKFIQTPAKPSITNSSSDALNEVLLNNIDDILNSL